MLGAQPIGKQRRLPGLRKRCQHTGAKDLGEPCKHRPEPRILCLELKAEGDLLHCRSGKKNRLGRQGRFAGQLEKGVARGAGQEATEVSQTGIDWDG